jgi:hypothetical protein
MNVWGLRLKPSEVDRVIVLLSENVVAIGWSDDDALLKRTLSKESFRKILSETYPSENLANALEHTWRFIREMEIAPRDMFVPDLHIDTLKVKSRNFH